MAVAQEQTRLPPSAFARRFPGLTVDHIDATADALASRGIAEPRGGKVLGDVFSAEVDVLARLNEQRLLLQTPPPEAAEYPDTLHGPFWVASDVIFIAASWNTNLVKPGEEPKQFEALADPRWKDRLGAEPRDEELLVGLARHKYRDDQKAVELMRKIAATTPDDRDHLAERFALLLETVEALRRAAPELPALER